MAKKVKQEALSVSRLIKEVLLINLVYLLEILQMIKHSNHIQENRDQIYLLVELNMIIQMIKNLLIILLHM